MQFMGFPSKWEFEGRIRSDLSSVAFGDPFRHPLLEKLFLEEDWSQHSIALLSELRQSGRAIWFMLIEHLVDQVPDTRAAGWPYLFIHYPPKIYDEARATGRILTRCTVSSTGAQIADGWVLRSWSECVKSKTKSMFENKVKADMREWCRGQLEEHHRKFPQCEACHKYPACHAYHFRQCFDDIASAVIERFRSRSDNTEIPKQWFTESPYLWCDYPPGFQEDFAAESAKAKFISLGGGCWSKPMYFRPWHKAQLLKQLADEEELARQFAKSMGRAGQKAPG
jgi:hypothetical protein